MGDEVLIVEDLEKIWVIRFLAALSHSPSKQVKAALPPPRRRQHRPVGAGGAMAYPDFGRSVNPILNCGCRLCPSNYNDTLGFSEPSYGPATSRRLSHPSKPRVRKTPKIFELERYVS